MNREGLVMISGLIIFLVGCLVLAIVLYVAHLVIDMLALPPNIKQIALIIIGLVGLLVLIVLTMNAFGVGWGGSAVGPPARAF